MPQHQSKNVIFLPYLSFETKKLWVGWVGGLGDYRVSSLALAKSLTTLNQRLVIHMYCSFLAKKLSKQEESTTSVVIVCNFSSYSPFESNKASCSHGIKECALLNYVLYQVFLPKEKSYFSLKFKNSVTLVCERLPSYSNCHKYTINSWDLQNIILV